ncbi:MAG: 3-oxoacyl-[acyl-carrier-protein] reductase [Bauldia sp.]|nr:3-oxoacyl-[acyl-carrier-protein] reductase [Bauldia sp.]
MFDLSGKVALVTGATGGIGGSIARALHRQGAMLALSGTRREALETMCAAFPDRCGAFPCNLTDHADADTLIPAVEAAFGRVDILVNNAGITRDGLLIRLSDQDWDDVIALNLTAAFRLTRAAMRGMLKRRYGRIISISSVIGIAGNPGQANYAAAKAGLMGMTRVLAKEVASRSITANCVAPGYIDTPMTSELNEKQVAAIMKDVPSDRLGTPDEVAAAVVYLASDEAAYVTGQTLEVNGGMHM